MRPQYWIWTELLCGSRPMILLFFPFHAQPRCIYLHIVPPNGRSSGFILFIRSSLRLELINKSSTPLGCNNNGAEGSSSAVWLLQMIQSSLDGSPIIPPMTRPWFCVSICCKEASIINSLIVTHWLCVDQWDNSLIYAQDLWPNCGYCLLAKCFSIFSLEYESNMIISSYNKYTLSLCEWHDFCCPHEYVCKWLVCVLGGSGSWITEWKASEWWRNINAGRYRWAKQPPASSVTCGVLLPQPRGGRAKLPSAGRMFESHPREKGEKPPLQSPNTETRAPANTRH